MVEYRDLDFKFNTEWKLYNRKKDTEISLEYDSEGNGNYWGRKDQYWIVFPDGAKSETFYNFTHACDNAKKYYLASMNRIGEIAH